MDRRVKADVKALNNWEGYWIDGERNTSTSDFVWTDGYTTGNSALDSSNAEFSYKDHLWTEDENCLIAAKFPNSQTINDVSCNNAIGVWGAVCGYQLN
ncbi:hypothetical protein B9Z55_007049 [Caenorhabditis nigoni]|uniref:C-type lectin domain-containing protein n=1 Tax=Caenorhabditis nigoni TaxID=1611254 RepID=A0A2G5V813_9PELO|nr:hypothetical protein B9Z55_007049 [Caenorhabditis nigoni]